MQIKHLLMAMAVVGMGYPSTGQITEAWVSPEVDYSKNGVMIAADAEGNSLAVSDIFHGDIYITKRDPSGNILWATGYDNTTPSQWEQAAWVTTDINNDVIVTGFTNTGFGSEHYAYQMVLMKFNGEDGALMWRVTDNAGSAKRGRVVMTDASGNIYVGGEFNAFNTTYYELGSMQLWKYSPAGTQLWTITTNLAGATMAGPLATMRFTPEGHILFAGAAPLGSSVTGGRATTDGTLLWTHNFPGYGMTDIDADNAGNTFILYTYGFGAFADINPGIKKLNASGTVIWDHNYDFGTSDIGRKILADNAGGAFVTGYSSQLAGMPYVDWITFRVNSSGDTLWSDRYDAHTNNDEWPWMMVRDNSNNIYITGQGGPWPGYFWLSLTQTVTLKYTAEGIREWTGLHDTYSNAGMALCLYNDNVLYVQGLGYDLVIRYDLPAIVTCDAPSGLFTNNITTTKARLNWTLEPGAVQYEVWYKRTTAVNWKKKFVPGVNNKLNLKNLLCNTDYVWKIRTVCDTVGVDEKSDFSPDQFFTMLVCREAMDEVENDGLMVYPNPAVASITMDAGSSMIAEIRVYNSQGAIVVSYDGPDINSIDLDVQVLPIGLYVIHCRTTDNIWLNKEFLIIR